MKQRSWFFFLALFLCIITIFVLYPTDERRIKKVINRCEEAIIDEDIDELMKYVSYNYKDDYGNNYLLLRKRMQIIFKNLDDVDIEKDIIKTSVKETLAEAEFKVRVIASKGADRGYIIGDVVKAQTIKVYFEKSPYKWRVIKVDGVFDYGL